MKKKAFHKKLTLKKETIAHLDLDIIKRNDLQDIKGAADQTPCWENLWTMYQCAYMYTGPATEVETQCVACG